MIVVNKIMTFVVDCIGNINIFSQKGMEGLRLPQSLVVLSIFTTVSDLTLADPYPGNNDYFGEK